MYLAAVRSTRRVGNRHYSNAWALIAQSIVRAQEVCGFSADSGQGNRFLAGIDHQISSKLFQNRIFKILLFL